MVGDEIEITTTTGETVRCDFLILGTGYKVNLASRPELASFADNILLWRDAIEVPAGQEKNPTLAYPYLAPDLSWRAETAAVFERIPSFADDPLWGETYRAGPVVFYYFAVWLAPFAPPVPEVVARRLRVRKATLEHLLGLADLLPSLAARPDDARPSAVVRTVARFAPRTLLTARMLDVSPRISIWLDRFMAEWRHVRPTLTGNDLRALGLPPGPLYTRILVRLLDARLDSEVEDEAGERGIVGEYLVDQ